MKIRDWCENKMSHGTGLWLGTAFALIVPVIMCVFLTYRYLGLPPVAFVPTYPNDFSNYWHEIESFRKIGLDTGYYTYMEATPSVDFRLGVHGPLYPIILGSLSKIFGWEIYSQIIYNLGFIAFAVGIFVFLVRPRGFQVALLGGMLVPFWPIHLYTASGYQESLHHAMAIILAAVWFRYEEGNQKAKGRLFTSIFGFLLFLSVLRFSWALFFIPLLYVEFRRRGRHALMPSVILGSIIIVGVMKFNNLFVPPRANVITGAFAQMSQMPWETLMEIWQEFLKNLSTYLKKPALEILLRVEFLIVIFGAPIAYLAARYSKVFSNFTNVRKLFPEAWLHCYLFASIFFASMLVYFDHAFYRVFSIVFVFSCFFVLARNHIQIVLAVTIFHAFTAFGLGDATREWIPNFAIEKQDVERAKTAFHSVLTYQPGAENPWCNSILTPMGTYDYRLTQAPAGFGLSAYHPAVPPRNIKSKYVLLKKGDYNNLPGKDKLKQILVLPDKILALFENTDSLCPTNHQN